MKLRRRLSQAQGGLDETGEKPNLALAEVVSGTRPGPEEAYRKRDSLSCHAEHSSAVLNAGYSCFRDPILERTGGVERYKRAV
jgi:hypothetical protein